MRKEKKRNSDIDWRIVLALFAVSFLFGLFLMNRALFHYDAIVLAEAVEKSYATLQVQPETNYRYANVLIAGIAYFTFWLAGKNADFAVRITGIVFFAASIAMMYLFLKRLSSNSFLALTAAVLMAVSPIYLSPNTFGKIHSISVFFMLTALWLALLPARINLVLAALSFVISLASRESVLFFVPFISILVIYAIMKHKQKYTVAVYFFLPLFFLFFLLYLAYFSSIIEKTINATSAETAFFTYRPWNMERALKDLLLTNGWIVLISAGIGIFAGALTFRFPAIFLLVWLGSAFVYFSNFTTYEARYLDVVLIPLYSFCGLLVSEVLKRNKIAAYVLIGILVFAPAAYSVHLMYPRTTYNGIESFGRLVEEKTEKDALIIVQNEAPVVGYYGKRQTAGPPTGNETQSIRFWEEIHRNTSRGQPVYLAFSALFYDPGAVNTQIVSQAFDFSKQYSTIDEDYHHSDIRQYQYITYLWKLAPKTGNESTTIPTPYILK